jgi:hypothetical protein
MISPINENFSVESIIDPRKPRALAEYLDLCENDPNIKEIMVLYNATRTNLEDIYGELLKNGCGGWINGHFAPLSSIAYTEPLMFILESKAQNKNMSEVALDVRRYWDEGIKLRNLIEIKSVKVD